MENCNCDMSLIEIPPRSPDLNAIENFFHLVRVRRKDDALQLEISKETFEEFKARVIRTIYSIPVHIIKKITLQCRSAFNRLLIRKVVALNIKQDTNFLNRLRYLLM